MNQLQIEQQQNSLRLIVRIFWLVIIAIALISCGQKTPAMELAPDRQIIKRAIAIEIEKTEQALSQQLEAFVPKLKISDLRVEKIEPIYIAKLPTYHLQGKYNLKLKLPRRQATQTDNSFELYLQRQTEPDLSVPSQQEAIQSPEIWQILKREKNSSWSSQAIQ